MIRWTRRVFCNLDIHKPHTTRTNPPISTHSHIHISTHTHTHTHSHNIHTKNDDDDDEHRRRASGASCTAKRAMGGRRRWRSRGGCVFLGRGVASREGRREGFVCGWDDVFEIIVGGWWCVFGARGVQRNTIRPTTPQQADHATTHSCLHVTRQPTDTTPKHDTVIGL
jgi:hypothetical protein